MNGPFFKTGSRDLWTLISESFNLYKNMALNHHFHVSIAFVISHLLRQKHESDFCVYNKQCDTSAYLLLYLTQAWTLKQLVA